MKFLCNHIDWDSLTHIGWDLDGTLYDEFMFIEQAYARVVSRFANGSDQANTMARFMKNRWLEKGSSYPYIFGEVLTQILLIDTDSQKPYIEESVALFRSTKPQLILNTRLKFVLEEMNKRYQMFIVTDGHTSLQHEKISALGLGAFFNENHIHISGTYGKGFEKPHTCVVEKLIESGSIGQNTESVLYIGDRLRDQQFAENAGFKFCYIHDLFQRID